MAIGEPETSESKHFPSVRFRISMPRSIVFSVECIFICIHSMVLSRDGSLLTAGARINHILLNQPKIAFYPHIYPECDQYSPLGDQNSSEVWELRYE